MTDPEGAVLRSEAHLEPMPENAQDDDWVARLSSSGPVHDDAVASLHDLMLRVARRHVGRMPESNILGATRRDEAIQSAANEATVSVLARLDSFEGRSKFTTWAYKFAILYAGVEVRRAVWNSREIYLHEVPEPPESRDSTPEQYSEATALGRAVRAAMQEVLTPHQRRVAVALLVDEVPIDVLADRLGTTRGALYKALHDARKGLRSYLVHEGYLAARRTKEVN